MASAVDGRRAALGLGATLATAVLIWFGTGLDPHWPLLWFAPVPVLVFALRASWLSAALVAGVSMVLGILNLWVQLRGELHLPLVVLVPFYLIEGILFALATLLLRALVRRGAYWSALLSLPAFWVSFEWLLNLTGPHGTGGSLAYSQLGFLPFLQLASVTGPWGMTFLLFAFAAALAIAIHVRNISPGQSYRVLVATGGVIAAVLLFGTARLLTAPTGTPVKVGLVSSDGPNENTADDGAPTAKLFQAYAPSVQRLAEEGAAVVVLPEKAGVIVEPDRTVDEQLQALADQAHVQVVAGVVRVVPAGAAAPRRLKYNEARIYTPGAPVESYDKEHMLPPFESNLTPGTSLTLLRIQHNPNPWGVEICKDMDFTQLSRRYGNSGVGLMLVPGWDFFRDWIYHGHMAIMRGVESGFSVVRTAKGGSLFVSDDRGRIRAELKSDAAPFAALLTSVPQTHDRTLFLLLGDWFAWVAVVILVLCVGRLMFGRRASTQS